jgi:hypothetical protein
MVVHNHLPRRDELGSGPGEYYPLFEHGARHAERASDSPLSLPQGFSGFCTTRIA